MPNPVIQDADRHYLASFSSRKRKRIGQAEVIHPIERADIDGGDVHRQGDVGVIATPQHGDQRHARVLSRIVETFLEEVRAFIIIYNRDRRGALGSQRAACRVFQAHAKGPVRLLKAVVDNSNGNKLQGRRI